MEMNSIHLEIDVVEKAGVLYESGRYELALETLGELKYSPSIITVSQYCSVYTYCQLILGGYDKALELIKSKLNEYPNNAQLHYLLAKIYSNLEKPAEGLQAVLRAIELDPEKDYQHTYAAVMLFKAGDIKKSDHHLRIAEELDPNSINNFFLRTLHFLKNDNQSKAKETIERGLQLHPQSTMLQSLFTQLDTTHRPNISFIKEMSFNALAEDPFDDDAKNNLLFSLKNENPIVRFFVARGFKRFKMEWTFGRVILMILFWKATLIWGSFALLYLTVTWAGTALFYSVIRKHPKYKYILPPHGVKMSNAFLILTAISIITIFIFCQQNCDNETLFGLVSGFLFLILTTISFFEIKSKAGKSSFAIFAIISAMFLYVSHETMIVFGAFSILLTLIYAFLFTLKITFR